MRTDLKLLAVVLTSLLPCATATAQVTLPKILSDHAVVQRDLPVHVWGTAPLGEHITVSFRGETKTVAVNPLGRWNAYLKPGAAGGPFELTVKGDGANDQEMVLHDILVGDVWVASGQSNMEFSLKDAETAARDIPTAANPNIRLLTVDRKPADFPQDDIGTTGWAASTPETAKTFSAVAWYFAREIQQKENVPVGVIHSSWGGTVAEAWVRMTALGEDAALNPLFASRGRMMDAAPDAERAVVDEQKQKDAAKAAGKPVPNFPWHAPLATWGPANLYNGMIAPLAPFAIRGVIWYQGESNSATERWPLYNRIMRTLIEDWRRQWGVGDFPFLYVEIANFKSGPHEEWANLRQQQVETLGLKNTAMAVTIDIGNPDDVHPKNKIDVGHRLALAARALNYGEAIEYSGPLFRQAVPDGNAIRVYFDHGKGLVAKGGEVTSVQVAGRDGKFVPAKAVIEDDTLVASSPDVPEPVAVRYGWANSPQCNLFNGAGLPASPFTSVKKY